MSDNGVPAEPRLASVNRQQLVLRSIDVERLVDEDHSARLIWLLIGRLDLGLTIQGDEFKHIDFSHD